MWGEPGGGAIQEVCWGEPGGVIIQEVLEDSVQRGQPSGATVHEGSTRCKSSLT